MIATLLPDNNPLTLPMIALLAAAVSAFLVFLFGFLRYAYLDVRSVLTRANVGLLDMVAMRLRRVNPATIVPKTSAIKALYTEMLDKARLRPESLYGSSPAQIARGKIQALAIAADFPSVMQDLIAVGVNRVLPHFCSVAHAEMMAYMLAQQRTQRARLNRNEIDEPVGPITLATSSQPCCQCYGATVWAGVDRLLIGARSEDVEELTEFDEGPLPADWVGELERRGIMVMRDVQREAARAVLRTYGESSGERY